MHTVGREGEQALGMGSLPSSRGGGKGGHNAERVWRRRDKLKDPREEGSEKGQGPALESDWMLGRKDERKKSGRIWAWLWGSGPGGSERGWYRVGNG